jgi:peptidoglycan LD-endopeptidase LytH
VRARLAAAFGLGFAAGMLVLAIALLALGRLTTAAAPQQPRAGARLAMPVAGIDPAGLHSNFDEVRGGHRHEALDIMAPRGTPVTAVAEGVVVKLFTSAEGGLTVYQFNDAETECYYYAHLDHYAPGLKEGLLLRRGDLLGYVGSTGNASPDAPHLHFAVFLLGPKKQWWKGTPIDPLPLLR